MSGSWNFDSLHHVAPGEVLGHAREHDRREQGDEGEQPDLDHGQALDAVVSPAEQQHQGEHEEPEHPPHYVDAGDQLHRLRHADEHRADLEQGDQDHCRPCPHHPVHLADAAGDAVEGFQPGLALGDGVAAQERLHERFDQAGEDDQPHHGVAHLGAERRGGDQLSGADDGGRQHDAGPDLLEDLTHAGGRLEDVRRVELVGVEVPLLDFCRFVDGRDVHSSPRCADCCWRRRPGPFGPEPWPAERCPVRAAAKVSPKPAYGLGRAAGKLVTDDAPVPGG